MTTDMPVQPDLYWWSVALHVLITAFCLNADDRIARDLAPGARVALETFSDDGVHRRVDGLTILDYAIPRGSIAGYYPELNPLIPLDYYDKISGTPAAKSIPVRMLPS